MATNHAPPHTYPLLALPNLGFKKVTSLKERVAINRNTGELIEWPWKYNPEDFLWTHDLTPFYNDANPKTYLEKSRQGLDASELFQDTPKIQTDNFEKSKIVIGERKKSSKETSCQRWYPRLRKKKFKKKKYKNSKTRQRKHIDKRHKKKAFKKEIESIEKNRTVIHDKDVCQFCLTESSSDNIFCDPLDKHCCDFCDKHFNGYRLQGKVCGDCLFRVYRKNFCEDCKKNLGEWDADWRMNLKIPMDNHPERCFCQKCIEFPCLNCEMNDHPYQACPWRGPVWPPPVYIEEAEAQNWEWRWGHSPFDPNGGWTYVSEGVRARPYYEYDYDPIEEACRDDYIFGWDH